MSELIVVLGDLPVDPSRPRTKTLMDRLDELEMRARTQGASPEMLASIQGARVLMGLAELPALPRNGLPAHATR